MSQYRGFEYKLWNTHFIKLTNLSVTKSARMFEDEFPNGERYISIPDVYKARPGLYAKRVIDCCYDRYDYHKNLEGRRLRGDYRSRMPDYGKKFQS